jgi:hypothetical protein
MFSSSGSTCSIGAPRGSIGAPRGYLRASRWVAILYYATPNVKQPKFRWISVGVGVAIITWVLVQLIRWLCDNGQSRQRVAAGRDSPAARA